jgi:hypothetical protein
VTGNAQPAPQAGRPTFDAPPGAESTDAEVWRPPRPGDSPSAIRPLRPFPPSGEAVARLLAAPPPAAPPTEAIPTVPGMPARTPAAPPAPEHDDDADDDDDYDSRRRPAFGRYDYAGTYGRNRGFRRDTYADYDDYDDADDDYADDRPLPVGDPRADDDYDDDDGDDPRDDAEVGVIWRAATPATPPAPTAPPPGRATAPPTAVVPQPDTAPAPPATAHPAEPPAAPGKRVRVVLAERKAAARPVRTVVDLQGDSPVGEALRTGLIVDQMRVALRFALLGGLTLGVLPLLFFVVPELGTLSILGLRLPWLVLGILVYPFLLGLGWWFTRTAERIEQDFADHIQDN